MTLEPLRREHFARITPQVGDRLGRAVNQVDELLKHPGYAVVYDGEVVALLGLAIMWPGVAQVWATVSPNVRRCLKSFQSTTRDLLRLYAREMNLHRVQTQIDSDFHAAQKWARTLGFLPEAELIAFGINQETYYSFVWFPKG